MGFFLLAMMIACVWMAIFFYREMHRILKVHPLINLIGSTLAFFCFIMLSYWILGSSIPTLPPGQASPEIPWTTPFGLMAATVAWYWITEAMAHYIREMLSHHASRISPRSRH